MSAKLAIRASCWHAHVLWKEPGMLDTVLVISIIALLATSLAFIVGCSVLEPTETENEAHADHPSLRQG
jgi:hypothetical protein